MFDLPDAKRVKRSRIFSSFTSSEDEVDEAVSESKSTLDGKTGNSEPNLRSRPGDEVREEISKSVGQSGVETINLASTSKPEDETKEAVLKSTRNSDIKKTGSGSRSKSNRSRKLEMSEEGDAHEALNESQQVDYGFEYEFFDATQAPISNHTNTTTKALKQNDNATSIEPSAQDEPTELESQTYAFNLFAPTPKPPHQQTSDSPTPNLKTTTTTYITIRSPTPPSDPFDPSKPGQILHPRPQTHYFTSWLPPSTLQTLKSQYTESAISGSTIHDLSTKPWPGTHLPWRILTIPPHKLTLRDPTLITTPTNPTPATQAPKKQSRARPSKKRRIQHRLRLAARETAKAAAAVSLEEEREKRTRRNREKKVKKKMRDKAKKAEAAAGIVNVNDESGRETELMDVDVDIDASDDRGADGPNQL